MIILLFIALGGFNYFIEFRFTKGSFKRTFDFLIQHVMKLLDYILSTFYTLYFFLFLLIFHPLQMIAFHFFGRRMQQKVVQWLNFFLLYGVYLTGTRVRFQETVPLPTDRPLIFAANHQSMFDIIGMYWYLRKHFPIFVSKIEIAKGIPSISYNLRASGAALIDRKDQRQALKEIMRLGQMIEETGFSAAIFPEGTRSTGKLKEFAIGGIATLIKKAPSALIVPVLIDGTGRFDAYKGFPFRCFGNMTFKTLTPIDPKGKSADEVVQLARTEIASAISDF